MNLFKIKIISIGLLFNTLQWVQAQIPCDKHQFVSEQVPKILAQYEALWNQAAKAKSDGEVQKMIMSVPSFLERGTMIGGMDIENWITITYSNKKQTTISDIRITKEEGGVPRVRITVYFTETIAGKSNIKMAILYLYPDNRVTITKISPGGRAYPSENPLPCITPSLVDNPPIPSSGGAGGSTTGGTTTGGTTAGGSATGGGKAGTSTAAGGKTGGSSAGGTPSGSAGASTVPPKPVIIYKDKDCTTAVAEAYKSAREEIGKATSTLSKVRAAAQKTLSFTTRKLDEANHEKESIKQDKSKLQQRFNDSVSALALNRLILQETEKSLRTARDSIQTEKREKEHFAYLLRLIRETIAGTVHHTAQLRSIFLEKAKELRAEFNTFESKEKDAEAKLNAATKDTRPKYDKALLDLRAAHENRVKTMWLTMDSIHSYKELSDTLLYNVYTYSMPERNPKPLPAHLTLPSPLPQPMQLLKMLHTVDIQSDEANFLKLDIIDNYAGTVMPLIPGASGESENRLASHSLDCFSKLLLSTDGNTSSDISGKIDRGFVENIMNAAFPSKVLTNVNNANKAFDKKDYVDALRVYMDSEKNFDKLGDPDRIAQCRYNYGVMLLWNLGDFAQKKKLFKGRTLKIIDERETQGRKQLLILQRTNNSFKDKAMLALAKHARPNR